MVEQGGRIWVLLNGKRVRRPFLDYRRPDRQRRRAGPALDGVRARLRPHRPFLRRLHGPQRRLPHSQEFRRSSAQSQPGRPLDRAAGAVRGSALSEPQRRPRCCSARTGFSTSVSETAASGGDPENRAQNLELAAREDPADRSAPAADRAPYRSPASNPFVGKRRTKRDLCLWAPQPLALLVRPKTGDLYIGDVGQDEPRGDRLRAARRGTRRNYGWSCFEGDRALRLVAQLSGRRRGRPSTTGARMANAP